MESSIDVVRSYYIAVNQCNLEKAGQYLAEDFRRIGPTIQPMGKAETLQILQAMQTAMPDLKHALSSIDGQGPIVKVTVQAGGRHMQPLDLSSLGMGISEGVVPSSGRMIIFLPNDFEYTVVNGKITVERNVTPSTLFNGVNGFLQAIGYAG